MNIMKCKLNKHIEKGDFPCISSEDRYILNTQIMVKAITQEPFSDKVSAPLLK